MKKMKQKKSNTLTLVLFVIYLLALTWLILFKLQFSVPVMEEGRILNLIPSFLGGSYGYLLSEIRNNVLVFVPFGIYICMLKADWSFLKKALAIVALTLAFELAQFIFIIGRADITDVLANTLGGLIGIGVYALAFKFMKGKTNKVINIFAAIITIFALVLTVFLIANNRWVRIR